MLAACEMCERGCSACLLEGALFSRPPDLSGSSEGGQGQPQRPFGEASSPEPLLNQLHEPGEARMGARGPHLIDGGGGT